MSDNTTIEWTDATWNPVTGCTEVSPGCDHCYARTFAERWRGIPGHHFEHGFDVQKRPERLLVPLRWRQPRRVFVNSMSDLFHDQVSDTFIAQVFAVVAATPQHTYQILTKRHGRMRSLLADECRCGGGHRPGVHLRSVMTYAAHAMGLDAADVWYAPWPLPNVWVGVSVEDQRRADLRVPALLKTPAAVRFLSCEPLLGSIQLRAWLAEHRGQCDGEDRDRIDWVIAGGESGPGARPMHPYWARQLRNQCQAASVPFLFKQWGSWTPVREPRDNGSATHLVTPDGEIHSPTAGIPAPFGAIPMVRCSKKAAGRLLDGRTWNQFPGEGVIS